MIAPPAVALGCRPLAVPAPDAFAAGPGARYDRFMSGRFVRAFLDRGGRVFIATERQPAEAVELLVALGHRHFAEKYVQEAEAKWPPLRARSPDLTLHDFGRLQTNKVRRALRLFDAIESVDRPSLTSALARRMGHGAGSPALYIQVNTGREVQKGGVLPEELERFSRLCRDDAGLSVAGLMAIPPRSEDPRFHFRLLRRMADRLNVEACCMGMSDDFEAAIDCGSTAIRIGRAVFGAAGA
jgi:pyridoxal phosphate enzyme (YggS family)